MVCMATDMESPQIFFMFHADMSTYHDYVTLIKV